MINLKSRYKTRIHDMILMLPVMYLNGLEYKQYHFQMPLTDIINIPQKNHFPKFLL